MQSKKILGKNAKTFAGIAPKCENLFYMLYNYDSFKNIFEFWTDGKKK